MPVTALSATRYQRWLSTAPSCAEPAPSATAHRRTLPFRTAADFSQPRQYPKGWQAGRACPAPPPLRQHSRARLRPRRLDHAHFLLPHRQSALHPEPSPPPLPEARPQPAGTARLSAPRASAAARLRASATSSPRRCRDCDHGHAPQMQRRETVDGISSAAIHRECAKSGAGVLRVLHALTAGVLRVLQVLTAGVLRVLQALTAGVLRVLQALTAGYSGYSRHSPRQCGGRRCGRTRSTVGDRPTEPAAAWAGTDSGGAVR